MMPQQPSLSLQRGAHCWTPTPVIRLIYSRDFLYALREKSSNNVALQLPEDIREPYRGCRAAKLKAKRIPKTWRFKPVVPSMIMGTVNSLQNKIDKLAKNLKRFRECILLCLTEMWLIVSIPDDSIELADFSVVGAVRDTKACEKQKGEGLQ